MAMKRNRIKLTEDERKKFDDIGLDEINEMTNMNSLKRLMQYMECVPRTPLLSPDLLSFSRSIVTINFPFPIRDMRYTDKRFRHRSTISVYHVMPRALRAPFSPLECTDSR